MLDYGSVLFFFIDSSTTEIYTLSLHDALPIYDVARCGLLPSRAHRAAPARGWRVHGRGGEDRKSTRLNSSHQIISYAVFCLKKKKSEPNHCCHCYFGSMAYCVCVTFSVVTLLN